MKLYFKKLTENAVMPKKAHPTDAGFDLVATSRWIDDDGNIVYGTGIAVEIPEGYAGFVFPRSSNSKKDLILSNCVGIIDSGYRGEIMAKFKGTIKIRSVRYVKDVSSAIVPIAVRSYDVGDRIAQLIILPYPEIEFEEAEQLSSTDRGEGGYGSTGK
jgi:dUTP pyrophosphatase